MNRAAFKKSSLWLNIGEVSVQTSNKRQAYLKCAQMPVIHFRRKAA